MGRKARLIDADALRLMTVEECAGHTIEYAMGWKACVDWIKTLPAVDAAPVVHGYWIGTSYDGYADGNPVYDEWECSECGWEHKGEDTPNYCQHCGARMDADAPTCGPDYCEIGGGDDAR